MERALALIAVLMLAGCAGPDQVTVPDTSAPFMPTPEDAMQPCPTAEREGVGEGVLPDVETGSRGEIIRSASEGARYIRTCDARHQTLREHIDAYLNQQRPPQER